MNDEKFESLFAEYIQSLVVDAAHDLQHIKRVVKTAKSLAAASGAKLKVVLPAAWLHDCVVLSKDHPLRHKASAMAADQAIDYLRQIDYPAQYLPEIHHAILAHSFSADVAAKTLEAKIVQDADRLDALGAIGVIRCLQVGAMLNRELYHIDDPFCVQREPNDVQFTLDHFYQKLLKLADTMQTEAGRVEAHRRHAFMLQFLQQFADEVS